MKRIIYVFSLLIFGLGVSQTKINHTNDTTNVTSDSVLIEFGADDNKGIILPYVENDITSTAVGGTLIFDVNNGENRVKLKNEDGTWSDLSGNTGSVDMGSQLSLTELNNKTIIGSTSTVSDGVVVLESSTQAMVLPIVSNLSNIPNPSAGMIVFVVQSGQKRFAAFNGNTWTQWKANP